IRRGVVTGSVLQGMAITVPFGGLTFLVVAIAFGELGQLALFPTVAVAWLAGQGIVHFVFGRYCNYKSNQLMGVNLSAPVVQLQIVVAIVWAVLTLHEIFTVLQALGSVLMLGGSFVTQRNAGGGRNVLGSNAEPAFRPQIVSGYIFALGGALGYGTSPLMAREAFLADNQRLPTLSCGNAVLANCSVDLQERVESAELAKLASVNFICPPDEARERIKRVEQMGFEETRTGSSLTRSTKSSASGIS